MIKSRMFSQAELQNLVSEVEHEVEAREAQRIERMNQERFAAYVNDPRNANEVNNHPVVKALRAMPASSHWGGAAPQQRPTAQPTQPGRLPAVINMNQRFSPVHLKMKPSTPQIDSVIDPYENGRSKRV